MGAGVKLSLRLTATLLHRPKSGIVSRRKKAEKRRAQAAKGEPLDAALEVSWDELGRNHARRGGRFKGALC